MHPKSPFHHETKELMCRPVIDDEILHKDVRSIKNSKDRHDFIKLQHSLRKLNEQYYHLEIAYTYAKTTKDKNNVSSMQHKINVLRARIRGYARIILEE